MNPDIRFPIELKAGLFVPETDEEALVIQEVKNVLLTTPGERERRPLFGSWLVLILQRKFDRATYAFAVGEVNRALRENISGYDPVFVDITRADEVFHISLKMRSNNTQQQRIQDIQFSVRI